jgi:hypothetical protein
VRGVSHVAIRTVARRRRFDSPQGRRPVFEQKVVRIHACRRSKPAAAGRVLAERRAPILAKARRGRRGHEKELAHPTRFATTAARGMVGWFGFPSRRAQEVGGLRDEPIGIEPRRANPGDAEVVRG